jgi:hypothetical protein
MKMAPLVEANKTISAGIAVVNTLREASYVENPQWKPNNPDCKAMIDRLLLEKISLAGIARVLELSEDWLQRYVNRCYDALPRQVQVLAKPKRQLAV